MAPAIVRTSQPYQVLNIMAPPVIAWNFGYAEALIIVLLEGQASYWADYSAVEG